MFFHDDLACDIDSVDSEMTETRSIYIRLYHTHLPLLDEADVVSFDAESKMVSLAENGGRLVADVADISSIPRTDSRANPKQ